MKVASQRVTVVAATEFWYGGLPQDVQQKWKPDVGGGPGLIEFAGRACYQSWSKPNPKTATNAGYIAHLLEVGHMSVLEHATISFYIEGVSRSLTHELVRHRHFNYSQLSQRYVNETDAEMIIPSVIADDELMLEAFTDVVDKAQGGYALLMGLLDRKLADFEDITNKTERRKAARQAARAILPNATETKIVVTGNLRALRHFFCMRATRAADPEIRELAIRMLRKCQSIHPSVFNDFVITQLDDGTETAHTGFTEI